MLSLWECVRSDRFKRDYAALVMINIAAIFILLCAMFSLVMYAACGYSRKENE